MHDRDWLGISTLSQKTLCARDCVHGVAHYLPGTEYLPGSDPSQQDMRNDRHEYILVKQQHRNGTLLTG